MAILRSTNSLLRTQLRPVAGASAPLVRRAQRRRLDVPAGQRPVSPNSGGPEMFKRNWALIGTGALLAFAGLKYWSMEKPPRTKESDLVAAMSTEIGYLPQPSPNSKPFDRNREIHAFSEMSGRKGGGSMGPFRAE